VEVAGVCSALARGLKERGHVAEVVLTAEHPFAYPADRVLRTRRERARFGFQAPRRYDVLHYHFNQTWACFGDALYARARRTPRLMHFHGDDCRLADVARREHAARARVVGERDDRGLRRGLRIGSQASSAAVVGDLELLSYVRDFFDVVYLLPLAVDVGDAPSPGPSHAVPRFVHAPSDPAIKGTAAIEAALREAAGRSELAWSTVSGRRNSEVLAAFEDADAVVDQLNSENYGVAAIEAMGRGRPVLAEFDPQKLASWGASVPVVRISPETLTSEIAGLAADRERRMRLGEAGRAFVEAVHAPERVAAAAEHMYEHVSSAPAPGVYEATAGGIRAV
jgi:glycosyltransferase involved in cell wall biosynthesis